MIEQHEPTSEIWTLDDMVEAIPPQYNYASTLKVEIKPGNNTADFAITSR
jgi:hypothetical protein